MVHARRLLDEGKLPCVEDILRDDTADLEFSERYAVRWLFFRFMMQGAESKRFMKVVDEARNLGGGSSYNDQLHKFIAKTFNAKALARLDEQFSAYLKALSPRWYEPFRSLDNHGEGWVQITTGQANAIAWRTAGTGGEDYELRGAFEILPASKTQMNVLLGRSDAGFVSVAFNAGFGVTVFHYHSDENRWEQLKAVEFQSFETGKKTDFCIRVIKSELTVEAQGQGPVRVSLGGRSMSGPWGLGALRGSVGIWYGVKRVEGPDR